MKLLAFLFLFGFASASFYDALDDAVDEAVRDFMSGMENAPPLRLVLGVDSDDVDVSEDDIKTEIGKQLKDALDHVLEKIKDAVDHGKEVKEDLTNKIKEIVDKLKELKIELKGKLLDKVKELKEKVTGKLKDVFDRIKEIFGGSKRSTDEAEAALADLNLKNIFEKLKEKIREKLEKWNLDALKEYLKDALRNHSELLQQLLKILAEKGIDKLKEFLDRLTESKEVRSIRSLEELIQGIKDYFKHLKIDIEEKYLKFGEWVKNVIDKGMKKSKEKLENVKEIAREFLEHTKDVSKEVAVQALEFFDSFKDALGDQYKDIKNHVKEILNRKD